MVSVKSIETLRNLEGLILLSYLEVRNTFAEVIMDWSDHYTEFFVNANNDESKLALKHISQLWIKFAETEEALLN